MPYDSSAEVKYTPEQRLELGKRAQLSQKRLNVKKQKVVSEVQNHDMVMVRCLQLKT